MEKLDIHDSENRLHRSLEVLEASSMSASQKKDMKQLVHELQIGKAASTKVKNLRLIAYLQFWVKLHRYFGKDFHKVTDKEVEKFIVDLEINKIKRDNGLAYKDNTKNEYIKAFKRYMGWYYKDNKAIYDKKYRWMKEYKDIVDKRAISLKQCEETSKNEFAKDTNLSLRNSCIFMFLFDSGCRIEEALNLKINQIEKHEKEDKQGFYYLVDIKVTKTLPRRISTPLCTAYLTKWLQGHPTGKTDDYLFPIAYDAVRKVIREMSGKSLGFKVTPHDLRHSSATYYCKKIDNPYKFCYRFGWRFGSKEANRYIDRNLLGEEEQEKLNNVIENDKLDIMEKEFSRLKIDKDSQDEKINKLSDESKAIWEWLNKISLVNEAMVKAAEKSNDPNLKKYIKQLLPSGKLLPS
jgi:integrase